MLYRFTGAYTRFYPQVLNTEGKSLMADPGCVEDFPAGPPDDGQWIPAEATPAGPEPAQEAPRPEPVPVVALPAPEPAPAPVAPAEPVPAPAAEPVPVAPAPAAQPFVFPGLSPYVRA